jgi:hypothetical protein
LVEQAHIVSMDGLKSSFSKAVDFLFLLFDLLRAWWSLTYLSYVWIINELWAFTAALGILVASGAAVCVALCINWTLEIISAVLGLVFSFVYVVAVAFCAWCLTVVAVCLYPLVNGLLLMRRLARSLLECMRALLDF